MGDEIDYTQICLNRILSGMDLRFDIVHTEMNFLSPKGGRLFAAYFKFHCVM